MDNTALFSEVSSPMQQQGLREAFQTSRSSVDASSSISALAIAPPQLVQNLLEAHIRMMSEVCG